jgi:hypothetical protein
MRSLKITLLISTLTFVAVGHSLAENWPSWRGPNHNGSTDEQGLPDKFSKTENLKWEATLPGDGASAPIVWGDGVYLTSVDESVDGVVAMKSQLREEATDRASSLHAIDADHAGILSHPRTLRDLNEILASFAK